MPPADTDFLAILRELASNRVEFIVIGGVGAVLQGAPLATFDLDVVHARDPQNVKRLLGALRSLGAHYREGSDRRLEPSAVHLAGPGHHLLMTSRGPLDVLGALTKGRVYQDLLPQTIELEVASGETVRVLDLAMLIQLKEELGREKDRAVLPLLHRTLEERDKT